MKKLLIATTALVATAGMASADITISGHAAAGIYSGLSNKDGTAAVKAKDAVVGEVTSAEKTILDAMTGSNTATVDAAVDQSAMAALQKAVADAQLLFDADVAAGLVSTTSAANLAFANRVDFLIANSKSGETLEAVSYIHFLSSLLYFMYHLGVLVNSPFFDISFLTV